MRTRKNIECLTTDDLHDLREAFSGIYQLPASDPNSFAFLAGLHGNPSPAYCIHGNVGFLTWHRAYLLKLENALRTIRCDVTLPYWNWSDGNTTGLPAEISDATYVNRAGDTVPNPLAAGPVPAGLGGGTTSRGSGLPTTTFGDLATQIQTALGGSSFSSFISVLNSVHGSIHGRIGGNMSSVSTAGYDPVFYFHHGNVDRLGAHWQASNGMQLGASEAAADLIPFNRPYSTSWATGNDYRSIEALGYRYRNFCLFIPDWPWFRFPLERIHPFPLRLPEDWVERRIPLRLHLSSPMQPRESAELRVFVDSPEANAKTSIVENPRFAGSIGLFGMGNVKMLDHQPLDVELDLTATLRKLESKEEVHTLTLVPVFPEKGPSTHMHKGKTTAEHAHDQRFTLRLETD